MSLGVRSRIVRRPTLLSGSLSIVAATAGVAALFVGTGEAAMGVAGAGVAFLVMYAGLVLRHASVFGWLVALAGLGAAAVSAGFAFAFLRLELEMLTLGLGVLGIFLAALAAGPLYGRGSRRLTMLACWCVFGAALVSADFSTAPQVLVAAVAAVLVWDLGENAIGLGLQVGRQAKTRWAELTHATGSVLVGVASAAAGYAAYARGAGMDFTIEAVILMLLAIVLLVAFMYR